MLPVLLQELSHSHPSLMQVIHDNQEEFTRLLMQPAEGGDGADGADGAAAPLGDGDNSVAMLQQMIQQVPSHTLSHTHAN